MRFAVPVPLYIPTRLSICNASEGEQYFGSRMISRQLFTLLPSKFSVAYSEGLFQNWEVRMRNVFGNSSEINISGSINSHEKH